MKSLSGRWREGYVVDPLSVGICYYEEGINSYNRWHSAMMREWGTGIEPRLWDIWVQVQIEARLETECPESPTTFHTPGDAANLYTPTIYTDEAFNHLHQDDSSVGALSRFAAWLKDYYLLLLLPAALVGIIAFCWNFGDRAGAVGVVARLITDIAAIAIGIVGSAYLLGTASLAGAVLYFVFSSVAVRLSGLYRYVAVDRFLRKQRPQCSKPLRWDQISVEKIIKCGNCDDEVIGTGYIPYPPYKGFLAELVCHHLDCPFCGNNGELTWLENVSFLGVRTASYGQSLTKVNSRQPLASQDKSITVGDYRFSAIPGDGWIFGSGLFVGASRAINSRSRGITARTPPSTVENNITSGWRGAFAYLRAHHDDKRRRIYTSKGTTIDVVVETVSVIAAALVVLYGVYRLLFPVHHS